MVCSLREMELREIGFTLPPGFRFHPSDHELVCHYLSKKVSDQERTMVEVDLHTQEPWELPGQPIDCAPFRFFVINLSSLMVH